jgi:hypothetical protein
MKDFEEKLTKFKDSNPVSFFYEFGMSPDEIKASIIESFNPYFENCENLRSYAVSDLVGTWLSYETIYKNHPDLLCYLKNLLDIFNEAKKVDKAHTLEAYLKWFPELNQSISRFWSLYNTQSNILELNVEDFSAEALRVIGQSIEGLSKPFLKLLLHLNRIKRKKAFDFLEIQSKDLGIVIDELINTTELKQLLIIQPNSIRLNQWRNIAYHHNAKIIGGRIFCSIKRNGTIEEFEISQVQLFDSLKKILAIFKLIRIAETIFCIDNIQQIQSTSHIEESQLNIREESILLDFYSSLSSQGFSIVDLKYDSDFATLDLCDMEEYGDFPKRAIHSSQFLYNLWLFTKSSKLIVNYFLFGGEKFFTSEITSENFLKHSKEITDLSKLLESVNFTFISTEYLQNEDPFTELNLSEEIKKHSQIFYSQQGQKISIEDFAKQFTLGVFCNYLALHSEGFNDIKINIGSDGSLARTEKPKSIVLQVPAKIESKPFQIELIKLLRTIIDLYEKRNLKREIVEEAKKSNRYFQKKALIRKKLREINH